MSPYVRVMRPAHWVKNVLVAVPFVFSGSLKTYDDWFSLGLALLSFSLAASLVYVVNDAWDAERDRLHPTKRTRPIASGEVSMRGAIALAAALAVGSASLSWRGGGSVAALS